MSDTLVPQIPVTNAEPVRRVPTDWTTQAMQSRIRRRYASERRFRFAGLAAVWLSAAFLAYLLVTMVMQGASGFVEIGRASCRERVFGRV